MLHPVEIGNGILKKEELKTMSFNMQAGKLTQILSIITGLIILIVPLEKTWRINYFSTSIQNHKIHCRSFNFNLHSYNSYKSTWNLKQKSHSTVTFKIIFYLIIFIMYTLNIENVSPEFKHQNDKKQELTLVSNLN